VYDETTPVGHRELARREEPLVDLTARSANQAFELRPVETGRGRVDDDVASRFVHEILGHGREPTGRTRRRRSTG
jgi:hypothetical protein